jgi:hypothetical protein
MGLLGRTAKWATFGPGGVKATRRRTAGRRAVATVAVAGLLAGVVVTTALEPAGAAGGTSCASADLKPSLRELMVSQGLPSYTNLVRGKDTLVRAFLSKPECASKTQTVTVTNVAVAVANSTASPAVALGAGSLFSPTGSFGLPTFYTGTPPANTPTDPILTVKGNVLTPCGAAASCPDSTAGFDATFTVTVTFTSSAVTGSQTVTFQATKPVAQKSNALRILVVPMGDANRLSSSQYSAAADAAVQQGMNTLSRILPVPCNANPADSTGACYATSLLSPYGGVRYAVSPGILDLSGVTDAFDTSGKFCGTQTNWEALKGTLAQFLESWNTANPSSSADRVVGVVDEAISSGVGTSPTGFSCADGMAASGSVAAWVRAMYSTQPSRTGGLLAMEVTHTLGGVPFPRSVTTHSTSSAADGTAPGRAYDLIRRAYIANARSAMKYDTTLPWNNDTTLYEKADQEFFLCHLGGPANTECATSGTTGAVTGAGAGTTVVMTGTTGFTLASTKIVMSYRTNDVAQPEFPDPAAPDPSSSTRLVITGGANPANLGVKTSTGQSDHDHGDDAEHEASGKGIIATAFEGVPGMTAFALYHCPSGTQACKDAPAANGGVLLYEAHKQPGPTTVGSISLLGAGQAANWTQDPSRPDTNPAVQSGGVAWVARCGACSNGATTIHLAPETDRTKVVELPLASGTAQSDPVWRTDGLAVAWIAGGDIWKASVDRSTVPYTVGAPVKVYAQGGSNPAASYPTWSPDGTKIYFGATNGGIRYVPIAGGSSSPLVSTSAKEAQPTAGSTLIAYTKKASVGTDIWTVDPTKPSSTQKLLATNGDQPWFGADGRVLFRRAGKIMSILANGTGLKQVSTGPDDQNPTSSGSTLGFDKAFPSDREVMLANLTGSSVQSSVTGPLGPSTKGELRLTCPDGAVYAMAVGVPVEQQSATQGTLTANYDESRACGGTGTLQWVCTDGFDLCIQGPSSSLSVTNSNKAPVATISSPASDTLISPTSKIALNGGASSPQGSITGSSLRWYVSGPGLPETLLGTGNRFDVSPPGGTWPNGTLTIRLQATAADGQVANALSYVVVDGVAPTVTLVSGPPPYTSSSTVTIAFTFNDTGGSTTVTQLCQLDAGEKVPCTSPVTYTGLAPGEHTVTVWIIDQAGNQTPLVIDFIVDGVAPTTVATLSPPPNANGWSTANVVATLTASDPSGVQSITYSLTGAQTGGATVPGSSTTITVTAPGTTTITYSATDNAGTVESAKQIVVRIDRAAPTLAITGTPTALGIPNTCVTLVGGCTYTGTASDAVSGVASVQLTFDGGLSGSFTTTAVCTGCGAPGTATRSYAPAPLQLLLGDYTVTAQATDLAGNVSAIATASTLHVL